MHESSLSHGACEIHSHVREMTHVFDSYEHPLNGAIGIPKHYQ